MIKKPCYQPDPIYRQDNVPLYESIYGDNLISLGGLNAIDNIFSDVNLNKLKALDVGFGLGGVAFYLSKKYQIEIAVAYSKGVLNHVKDKKSLFREINRVLKTDGLFVIADWIYPEANSTDDSSPLVNETQETYLQFLKKTGFTDISFRDDSDIFLGYVKKLLENITTHREFIEKRFGTEMFSTVFHDHLKLIDDINDHRKFAIRIKAKKS